MPHTIRLRGPWECEAIGPDESGPFRYSRRFHQPTGLEAGSKVWLVVEGGEGEAEVSVNGVALGSVEAEGALRCAARTLRDASARFEITALLQARNEVVIKVTAGQGGAGGLGLVRLEIEEEREKEAL